MLSFIIMGTQCGEAEYGIGLLYVQTYFYNVDVLE